MRRRIVPEVPAMGDFRVGFLAGFIPQVFRPPAEARGGMVREILPIMLRHRLQEKLQEAILQRQLKLQEAITQRWTTTITPELAKTIKDVFKLDVSGIKEINTDLLSDLLRGQTQRERIAQDRIETFVNTLNKRMEAINKMIADPMLPDPERDRARRELRGIMQLVSHFVFPVEPQPAEGGHMIAGDITAFLLLKEGYGRRKEDVDLFKRDLYGFATRRIQDDLELYMSYVLRTQPQIKPADLLKKTKDYYSEVYDFLKLEIGKIEDTDIRKYLEYNLSPTYLADFIRRTMITFLGTR